MPRFEIRLEAQDESGHFRITRLVADSKEAAVQWAERKELQLCAAFYDEDALPDGEKARSYQQLVKAAKKAAANGERLPPEDRARIAVHEQTRPYKVVKVTEVKGR